MNIREQEKCPKCGAQWQGEDIFEYFMRVRAEGDPFYGSKTEEEIREVAGNYGWSEENRICFTHLIGVELEYNHPWHYDGVSYWQCHQCKTTWNRWSNEEERIPTAEEARNIGSSAGF